MYMISKNGFKSSKFVTSSELQRFPKLSKCIELNHLALESIQFLYMNFEEIFQHFHILENFDSIEYLIIHDCQEILPVSNVILSVFKFKCKKDIFNMKKFDKINFYTINC